MVLVFPFSFYLTLYKMGISQRWSLTAIPKGLHLEESWLYVLDKKFSLCLSEWKQWENKIKMLCSYHETY